MGPWASEGGADFGIISKKRLFFQFRGVKNKFHHFWPPLEKNFGKIPYWTPLEKILPTPMDGAYQSQVVTRGDMLNF